jgi:hypothetical protein
MRLRRVLTNAARNVGTARDATRTGNLRVIASLMGPAARGFLLQVGKRGPSSDAPASHSAHFVWDYQSDSPELAKLYAAAKSSQWDGATDLDWSIDVDPYDPARALVLDEMLPLREIPAYRSLPPRRQAEQRQAILSWLLSQFLHGEQGALYAACQVTEGVPGFDGKLYGSTQVVDEGRHVEVFHRYLAEKLRRVYPINDNLFVIVDALMRDSAWDLKFLGMQILIEGLALGAFGTMRASSREPLLRELLKYVITDEARHVHYGVVTLRDYYERGIDERTRRDREDWAFEMSLLLRNRFLAHEFYDEHYGHAMSRRQWDQTLLKSDFMRLFRDSMFRRIVPNLKRIHLLSDRIRPHYQALGLLAWEHEKAAPELSVQELVDEALPGVARSA